MNGLREHLAARSVTMSTRMLIWGLLSILAFAIRGLISWLYPGWWPLSFPLFVIGMGCVFAAGRATGWRDCWQEVLRFMISRATKGQK